MDRYQLAQVFSPSTPGEWRLRQGQAVSVQSDYTATIKIAGSDVQVPGVKYLNEPIAGKGIWLMTNGIDLFILGSITDRITETDRAIAPRVYRTTNQTIDNASATPITWQAIDANVFGAFSSASQVIVNIAGRYMAVGQVNFASNATGLRSASVLVNGVMYGAQRMAAYSAVNHISVSAVPFTVTSTASISMWVEQDSGGVLDVIASDNVSPGLGIYYLGA